MLSILFDWHSSSFSPLISKVNIIGVEELCVCCDLDFVDIINGGSVTYLALRAVDTILGVLKYEELPLLKKHNK